MVQAQQGPHGDIPRLTPSWWSWLAWSLAGLTFLLMVGTLWLVWWGRASLWRATGEDALAAQVIAVLGNALAPIIGALIAARQPRNAYGWLWLVSGLVLGFRQGIAAYAFHNGNFPETFLPLQLDSAPHCQLAR